MLDPTRQDYRYERPRRLLVLRLRLSVRWSRLRTRVTAWRLHRLYLYPCVCGARHYVTPGEGWGLWCPLILRWIPGSELPAWLDHPAHHPVP